MRRREVAVGGFDVLRNRRFVSSVFLIYGVDGSKYQLNEQNQEELIGTQVRKHETHQNLDHKSGLISPKSGEIKQNNRAQFYYPKPKCCINLLNIAKNSKSTNNQG